jgi:tRNA threonylcarbamoyladenosine biosynthesis protein TsaB
MKVLAIDTASNVATAAVAEDGIILGERILNFKKTHSQKIMPMISELFAELELKASDIDVFAVANGPGSFTGLRIGVATIKALAHSVGKPVVGVSTLAGLAYNLPYCEHIIVPIMDARRNQVYTASYIWDEEGFRELSPDEAISIEECADSCGELLDTVFVGDGVPVHRAYLEERLGERAHFAPASALMQRASSIAMIAMEKAKRGETQNYNELVPFYLRKSQAEREYEEKQKKNKE